MKKKVMLLLAFIIILSMFPMNVFGKRPAQITSLITPNDDALNYRLSFDAEVLSNAVIPSGGELFLEFTVDGENAGFRIFRNNGVSVSADPVTGIICFTETRPMPTSQIFWGNELVNRPHGESLHFAIFGGVGFAIVPSKGIFTAYVEAEFSNLSGSSTPLAAGTSAEQVLDNARGASVWGDEFTHGLRRRMAGDINFRPSDVVGRDTTPMEHWRTISVPLSSIAAPGANTLPEMTGWIEVLLPMIAPEPETFLTAKLRSMNSLGQVSTIYEIANLEPAGSHNSGLLFESRGVAAMTNIAKLNAIRITEAIPGYLSNRSSHSPVWQSNYQNHIVRLVAPKGFRWERANMPGIISGNSEVEIFGNPTNWPGRDASNEPNTGIRNAGGQATWLDTWLNPVTCRHEVYVHIAVPVREDTLASRVANAWVDISGLALIPTADAPASGDIAIDVWVGTTPGSRNVQWDVGTAVPSNLAANAEWDNNRITPQIFELGRTLPDGTVRQTRFGWFGENDAPGSIAPSGVPGWRQEAWSHMNLVVADIVPAGLNANTNIDVMGPVVVESGVSGGTTAPLTLTGNGRFINGENHTIRLTEQAPGAMFHNFDIYELRSLTPGINFVDAQIRVGNANAADYEFNWTLIDTGESNNDAAEHVVNAITDFAGGSLHFAPRTIENDEQGRFRHMDIRIMLSIEAGYEANHGGEVEIEVLRNGASLGSVVVLYVTDPIAIERSTPISEIVSSNYSVIPPTPVGDLTIVETEAGRLAHNDEIWLHVQATHNGQPVWIPQGMLALFVGHYEINSAQSDMIIEALPSGFGNQPKSFINDIITSTVGFRVVSPSEGVPGRISFNNMFVSGPTLPDVEWHVVVSGSDSISPNSYRYFLESIGTNGTHLGVYQERARFPGMPYHATFAKVLPGGDDCNCEVKVRSR